MKKYILLLLFFASYITSAQENVPRLSVTFENASMEEVLLAIEQKTSYKMYFVGEWLTNEQFSGSYQDIALDELLSIVLEGSLLNYYIGNDARVILTKNNIIYDSLPEGFFDNGTVPSIDVDEQEVAAPVFYNETTTSEVKRIETIRIGREDKSSERRRFLLTGKLVNTTNGGPAPNIAITVKGKDIGVVTDKDGAYTLELPAGLNVLETNSLEFEKIQKRVVIYNDGVLDFGLNEAYVGLGEVLIQANVDRNVKDANIGITKIDVKEIKNIPLVLGERDIFKVAATLPGISSAGEGASGYNVRGGKTDQNLVLLDEGVIYNPAHFFGIFSAINPFTTDEVTIYKGNVPAKFGGRLSSVFDIKTKDANVEKFSGEASIGPVTSNLVLEAPIEKGKGGILVGGRSTYSDWILRNLDEEELRKSSASFFDVIVKYNHKLDEKNDVSATAYYSKDKFSITSDSLFGYSNRLFAVQWNRQFNDKHSGNLNITNSQYQFDIDFDGQTNTNFELGYTITETEAKLNMNYASNERHSIDYGFATKLYNVEPGSIGPKGSASIVTPLSLPEERALESAVYISDLFEVTDKLTIEAGLRYSFYAALGESSQNIYADGVPRSDGSIIEVQEFGKNDVVETYGAPEIRASGRYLLGPTLSAKASFNTNYQYIHRLSSNTTVSPTDTWKLSNINIKPQRATQYALGLFKNFKDNTYELSLEGYYKKVDDILDYKVGAELLLNEDLEQDVLQGDGKAYGLELLLKKTKGRLNGWVGYTYARSFVRLDGDFPEERVNDGAFFPSNFDKPHDFSVVGNFKLTQRFSFSANLVYQTGRPVTVPVGNFILNDTELVLFSDRNEFRVPDYYRLDISFNIEGNHKLKKLAHSFWNISIYNVLGRNNPYSVFFVTEGGEIKAYQSSIFSIPIPTISYNLKF